MSNVNQSEKCIIAYIAPIGSDLTNVDKTFKILLEAYGLDVQSYALSKHFAKWLRALNNNRTKKISKGLKSKKKYEEMKAKIEAGDLICEMKKDPAVLITFSLKDIQKHLRSVKGKGTKKNHKVILFRQLKRSAEVVELRKKFGDGLFY